MPAPLLPAKFERLIADTGTSIVELLVMPDTADVEFEPVRVDAICQPVEFD